MKRVKIVATVGPACDSPKVLRQLIHAGVNCFRFNTAFADLEYYRKIIRRIRSIAPIPILLDIKGSDIRLVSKSQDIKKGQRLKVSFLKGPVHFSKDFKESSGDSKFKLDE